MSTTDVSREPSLFDHALDEVESGATPPRTKGQRAAARDASAAASALRVEPSGGDAAANATQALSAAISAGEEGVPAASTPSPAPSDRKRLAEQLDALKRKEFELRRALAAADHPELAEAIRLIEGRAFNVARAEAKLAQGFSKTEARRREVIEKKLSSLRDKRAELDGQIATLETELSGLGADRLTTFQHERQEAMQQLMTVLATHEAALSAAGLSAARLVPEIEGWMPELEALASTVSSASV